MAILNYSSLCPSRTVAAGARAVGRRAFLGALLLLAAGWLAGTVVSIAQEPAASENQVKAGCLLNLPKYVDWPAEAFAGANDPIIIAVAGETKVAGEIQKAVGSRTINGRGIMLKRVAAGEEAGICHILFIGAAEQKRAPELLAGLKGGPVLTVGESDGFLADGGIINLARRDQKVALEVNLAAAGKARIKISSKLLSLAKVVVGKAQ